MTGEGKEPYLRIRRRQQPVEDETNLQLEQDFYRLHAERTVLPLINQNRGGSQESQQPSKPITGLRGRISGS